MIDGLDAMALATLAGVPRVALCDLVSSTMDEANDLAEQDALSGTVVIAERQSDGRGRFGRRWSSEPGMGLWMTLLEREVEPSGLGVLSLRVGLAIAPVLDRFVDAGVQVSIKWPNDLLVNRRKLAGVLIEARWRESTLEWVTIGIGVNLIVPLDQPAATALVEGTRRSDLFRAIVAPVRAACAASGQLTQAELLEFSARDAASNQLLAEPTVGRARGITSTGALLVETSMETVQCRRGSLVFASEDA